MKEATEQAAEKYSMDDYGFATHKITAKQAFIRGAQWMQSHQQAEYQQQLIDTIENWYRSLEPEDKIIYWKGAVQVLEIIKHGVKPELK